MPVGKPLKPRSTKSDDGATPRANIALRPPRQHDTAHPGQAQACPTHSQPSPPPHPPTRRPARSSPQFNAQGSSATSHRTAKHNTTRNPTKCLTLRDPAQHNTTAPPTRHPSQGRPIRPEMNQVTRNFRNVARCASRRASLCDACELRSCHTDCAGKLRSREPVQMMRILHIVAIVWPSWGHIGHVWRN